jgi:hypothetical protein
MTAGHGFSTRVTEADRYANGTVITHPPPPITVESKTRTRDPNKNSLSRAPADHAPVPPPFLFPRRGDPSKGNDAVGDVPGGVVVHSATHATAGGGGRGRPARARPSLRTEARGHRHRGVRGATLRWSSRQPLHARAGPSFARWGTGTAMSSMAAIRQSQRACESVLHTLAEPDNPRWTLPLIQLRWRASHQGAS